MLFQIVKMRNSAVGILEFLPVEKQAEILINNEEQL